MSKVLKYLVVLVLLLLLGAFIVKLGGFNLFKPPVPQVTTSSSVVLERMEKVMKLVTLEVHLSEFKEYKDHIYYDISPLRKEALIIVNGRVSIGYDFNDIQLEADEQTQTITILDLPDPEIIAVEHDLDYRMLSEGTFNSFTKEDYNNLNRNAKELITSTARERRELFLEAEDRKDDLIDMIRWMLNAANWDLVVGSDTEVVKNPENTY